MYAQVHTHTKTHALFGDAGTQLCSAFILVLGSLNSGSCVCLTSTFSPDPQRFFFGEVNVTSCGDFRCDRSGNIRWKERIIGETTGIKGAFEELCRDMMQ